MLGVVRRLQAASGEAGPLHSLHAAIVSSASPPPAGRPIDFGVAKLASLLNLGRGSVPHYSMTWSPDGLCRRMWVAKLRALNVPST